MSLGLVALVGAPNVGKSTIFNRFVGTRQSIVEDTPGVTRDRIYGSATWLTKQFRVVDTGGIEIKDKPFQTQIRAQVQIAIDEADLIIFLVDGKSGLTGDDQAVAKLLYKCKKPVILAVNKIDNIDHISDLGDFYALGLGDPIAISGAHVSARTLATHSLCIFGDHSDVMAWSFWPWTFYGLYSGSM